MLDLILKNARIVDGTGAPWFWGDVAVKDGRIQSVGRLPQGAEAAEIVDAQGLFLCPGFIDIHSHSDGSILTCPLNESRVLQGVTTEIAGNCGMSMAPATQERLGDLKAYTGGTGSYQWRSMGDFLHEIEAARPSTNLGMLMGHGTLRLGVMGYSAQKPTRAQVDAMRAMARAAMEEGAFGISSGLIYPPGSYADTDELAEVVSAIAPYGGYYATHMRDEDDKLADSVKEALEIARRAGVPLQISHHKCLYKPDWRVSCKTTVAMIQQARRQGQDVTCDQYPYRATATTLSCNIPGWAFEGGFDKVKERLAHPATRERIRQEVNACHDGRWDTLYVSFVQTEQNQWMCGKSIPEIAQAQGKSCADAMFDIIVEENDRVGEVHFAMCEEDIEFIMSQPFVMTGSDGEAMALNAPGKPHPRNYGAFPRILAHYCRKRKLFSMEEAVRKLTSMPAARAGIGNRGLIRPGMRADLVLFDFDKINDDPDYQTPQRACSGIERVYVNGMLSAKDGAHTGARAGMALRKEKET